MIIKKPTKQEILNFIYEKDLQWDLLDSINRQRQRIIRLSQVAEQLQEKLK